MAYSGSGGGASATCTSSAGASYAGGGGGGGATYTRGGGGGATRTCATQAVNSVPAANINKTPGSGATANRESFNEVDMCPALIVAGNAAYVAVRCS